MKAILISGFLEGLSDNIKPLLDKQTDVYIHTWDHERSNRWVKKLNRYKKYCNNIIIETEESKFEKKLYSYVYSTYKAANLIKDLTKYTVVIKFKPNLDGELTYKGDTQHYFHKAFIQSRPLLDGVRREMCVYGSIYYSTLDERVFTIYPKGLRDSFHIPENIFLKEVENLDKQLIEKYGPFYEGSIFWKEWFEARGLKLIQDLDLKIPNNKSYE